MEIFVKVKPIIAVFLVYSFSLFALKPHSYRKEQKYLVNVPVVTVYEECKEEVPDSQLIYGASVAILQELEDDWVQIEIGDHYKGFVKKKYLYPDNPRWRTSRNLCRVSSLGSLIYPIPDTEIHYLARLSFGSFIETKTPFTTNRDRWLKARLLDEKEAWVQRGDLEKPHVISLEEMLSLTHRFLGLPYIWGGGSSSGYDCSGFVQTMFRQMGWILPRNSSQQAESPLLTPITREKLIPGDILFFGNPRITHVGIHLGNEKFIHSGVRNLTPRVNVIALDESEYIYRCAGRINKPCFTSSISHLTPEILKKLSHSCKNENLISTDDLRYIQVNHWGFDYCIYEGELIVHKDAAEEIVDIFKELFTIQYPIEKMLLIEEYEANDELSCEDNNSYASCSHSEELFYPIQSLTINPLLNPLALEERVIPSNGKEFLDRTLSCRGLITEEDPLYQAFIKRGWKWGGHSNSETHLDYQHFYKELF